MVQLDNILQVVYLLVVSRVGGCHSNAVREDSAVLCAVSVLAALLV